jgi:hypothetical protein
MQLPTDLILAVAILLGIVAVVVSIVGETTSDGRVRPRNSERDPPNDSLRRIAPGAAAELSLGRSNSTGCLRFGAIYLSAPPTRRAKESPRTVAGSRAEGLNSGSCNRRRVPIPT